MSRSQRYIKTYRTVLTKIMPLPLIFDGGCRICDESKRHMDELWQLLSGPNKDAVEEIVQHTRVPWLLIAM
jgi:predicted DCC family thiol-disulfide oxidoreductase YuxK